MSCARVELTDNMFHSFNLLPNALTLHPFMKFMVDSVYFVESHSVNGHNSLMYENKFLHGSRDTQGTPSTSLEECARIFSASSSSNGIGNRVFVVPN